MEALHQQTFCPPAVTALFEDLEKQLPIGHEAGKFLGPSHGQVFPNSAEEKVHHMALATATDFYNMVRYLPNACLSAHGAERKYLVAKDMEQVTDVRGILTNAGLTLSEETFVWIDTAKPSKAPDVWHNKRIERQTNATKDVKCMVRLGTDDATTYAVAYEKNRPHAKDNSIKHCK
ncbi:hypothetical protein HDU89_004770 [Geranomyces variabilis]|nr:hypothetical protein HDU89_004770 [Geranomyces variabilis]